MTAAIENRMLGRDHTTGKRRSYYVDEDRYRNAKKLARRYSRHVEAQAFAAYVRAVTS